MRQISTARFHASHMMLAKTYSTGRAGFLTAALLSGTALGQTQVGTLSERMDARLAAIQPKLIQWRRDFHAHPELANYEVRTARVIANELRRLGIETRTEIAHTGVVGILRGGRPGLAVALRADMDALPLKEESGLPFTSKVERDVGGKRIGVSHACGHDAHVAILLGVAEVLASLREDLSGTVLFIFQPAEEGVPEGQEGGAEMMVKQGVLNSPVPVAIFGLHVIPNLNTGMLAYRSGPLMASEDRISITVHGRPTHAALPWTGIDPIVTSAEILLALQTVVSRQTDPTKSPTVLSIGSIRGGASANVIADAVEMTGTLRTFDADARKQALDSITRTATGAAASSGAVAQVEFTSHRPTTINDPSLTERSVRSLRKLVGDRMVIEAPLLTTSEDFSFYAQKVPAFYFLLGATPQGKNPLDAAPNHSPRFVLDEKAMALGARVMTNLTLHTLNGLQ